LASCGAALIAAVLALGGIVESKDGLTIAVVAPFVLRALDTLRGRQWPWSVNQKSTGVSRLHRAAREQDLAGVRALLAELAGQTDKERKATLNAQTEHGYTAFMLACEGGAREIAVMLLEAGCDGSMTSSLGRTGAQIAALAGHHALVGYLAQDYAALSQVQPDPADRHQDSYKIPFARFVFLSNVP